MLNKLVFIHGSTPSGKARLAVYNYIKNRVDEFNARPQTHWLYGDKDAVSELDAIRRGCLAEQTNVKKTWEMLALQNLEHELKVVNDALTYTPDAQRPQCLTVICKAE